MKKDERRLSAGMHVRRAGKMPANFHTSQRPALILDKKRYFILFLACFLKYYIADAGDFIHVERQKLKLSLEYENYVGIERSEIATSGVKATYLLKANRELGKKAQITVDLQSGAKSNFDRQFQSGRLPVLMWSNRAATSLHVPMDRFFITGTFYLRNKWLSHVSDSEEFVDIFGGEGFREITAGVSAGYTFSPEWEISGSVLKSDLNYSDFPESNSNWTGVSFRLSRRFDDLKLSFDFRNRSIDYERPITPIVPIVTLSTDFFPNQHDQFLEAGVNLEVLGPLYFSGGYYYQSNDSNNPGFSFNSHRITILIGAELAQRYYVQAYGILQRQSFPGDDVFLQFPVLLDENDNNTMAASIVRKISERNEMEAGLQILNHNSPFAELDASKYILYAAYNFRF